MEKLIAHVGYGKSSTLQVFPRLKLVDDAEADEEFFRQKVLLFVPWNPDTVLKQDEETWKDVYDRHRVAQMKTNEVNINVMGAHENPFENADVELMPERCEDWMIASRLSARGEMDEIELGRRQTDVEHDWHSHAVKYESFGDIQYFKSFIENEKQKEVDESVSSDMPDVTFSAEQDAVKTLMEKQIAVLFGESSEKVPKRVLVQGKAGTGKSLLIKYLTDKLVKQFGNGSYLLLGPTGVSAVNIGGSTIHSALRFPRHKSKFKELTGEGARKFCDMMEKVKFVIIDEYSMIGCSVMGMIDKRLREATGVYEAFGSLNIYFFGDYKQLPPVKDPALYERRCDNDLAEHGKNVFDSIETCFVLSTCHRQKDPKFQGLLDRLSIGKSTLEDYNVLKTRFMTHVSYQEQRSFDNATRIFATKAGVRNFNDKKLKPLCDENGNIVPIARVPAKHHGKGASQGSVDDANGLDSVLTLSRGCRIMLRTNLWVKQGLVNGSMGTVVDLIYEKEKGPPDDAPAIIMCKFDLYSGPGIGPDNLVPLSPIIRSWTSRAGDQCTRQQFPIAVSYACSIHKSQGLTMDKVVVDAGNREFSLGLCYVALSRVKTFDGLLLQPFSFERLQAVARHSHMKLRNEFGLLFE